MGRTLFDNAAFGAFFRNKTFPEGGGSVFYMSGISEGAWGKKKPSKMENPRGWGILCEIPFVVGYGYFLEPHISTSSVACM